MSGPDSKQRRLRQVVCRALGLPPGSECDTVEFRQMPRWDSLAHLQLVVELEREFAVTIENDDVLQITSYRSVLELLQRLGV